MQEIDAYWLQRRISQTLSNLDEHSAQKLAQEVLEALQVGSDRETAWRRLHASSQTPRGSSYVYT